MTHVRAIQHAVVESPFKRWLYKKNRQIEAYILSPVALASMRADAAAIECLRVEAFLRARGGLNEIQAERVARELYAMDDLYQDAERLAAVSYTHLTLPTKA